MPEDLRAHLRYPEDLFRIQTNSWAKYHVTDADSFYQGNDFWDVARDPGTGTAPGRRDRAPRPRPPGLHAGQPEPRIDPYYLFTKLPGADATRVRPPATVRAGSGERRQPAHDGVHGGQERRRQLRPAPGVHHARSTSRTAPPWSRARSRARRRCRARRASSAKAGPT